MPQGAYTGGGVYSAKEGVCVCVCVCVCAYASGAASSRTSNREMVICNLADKLPSVDWKIRRTSLEILLAANWLHDIEKTPGPRLSSALS